ncbi:hypothetical protein [Burkholderia lata]|nr:hypothetical protein [Burkholderia lata]
MTRIALGVTRTVSLQPVSMPDATIAGSARNVLLFMNAVLFCSWFGGTA